MFFVYYAYEGYCVTKRGYVIVFVVLENIPTYA
jgi:hypothetical protein